MIDSTSRSMRAVRIVEPGLTSIEEAPIPEPGRSEVRLRLEGCGVCASNLGPWKGLPWLSYPLQPGDTGHEAWGVVDALGPGVRGVAEGDRVAALTYKSYAEYDIARADALVPLPAVLDGRPFPGEPLGCAMNIFRRSDIREEHTLAVVGAGFLGAVVTRLANRIGARVLAVSRREFSLEVARAMGAEETIRMDDHGRIVEQVRDLTRGLMCDRVIEAVGLQWPLDLAAELTRERGRLVVAGYHQDGNRRVNMQMWNWKGLDVINAHERDPAAYVRGMREAVEATQRGDLDPGFLITHELPLERLDEALDATSNRPHGFLKAVVRP